MADEAPAAPAPAAEGAGIYEVYTSPNGYQNYQIWTESTSPDNSTGISIKGTKQYLIVDSTGAWGGYNGLPHGPNPRTGAPYSVEMVLRLHGRPREELMCFQSVEKVEPWQIYSSALREEDKRMPFPLHAAWSGFLTELPSLESWGSNGPPDHFKSFYVSTSYRGTATTDNY